jgi:hypothetical protein
MDRDTRQKACDAFNALKGAQLVHPEALYDLIDDTNRKAFLREVERWMERPKGYSKHKDYVALWRGGNVGRPYVDLQLVEVREFIQAASKAYLEDGVRTLLSRPSLFDA